MTTQDTQAAIAEIRERAEKATEGPWRVDGPDMFGDYNILHPADSLAVGAIVSNLRDPEQVAANAALAVLAVNNILPIIAALEAAQAENDALSETMHGMQIVIDDLHNQINSPVINDWFDGVRIEVVHQRQRWGADHDAGKQPHDWFWLLGYLGGKCLASHIAGNADKAKHHTVSTGAALFNWFMAITGQDSRMRPGIEDPQS